MGWLHSSTYKVVCSGASLCFPDSSIFLRRGLNLHVAGRKALLFWVTYLSYLYHPDVYDLDIYIDSCPNLSKHNAWVLCSTYNPLKVDNRARLVSQWKYYHVRETKKPGLSGHGWLYSEGGMAGQWKPLGFSSAGHIPVRK